MTSDHRQTPGRFTGDGLTRSCSIQSVPRGTFSESLVHTGFQREARIAVSSHCGGHHDGECCSTGALAGRNPPRFPTCYNSGSTLRRYADSFLHSRNIDGFLPPCSPAAPPLSPTSQYIVCRYIACSHLLLPWFVLIRMRQNHPVQPGIARWRNKRRSPPDPKAVRLAGSRMHAEGVCVQHSSHRLLRRFLIGRIRADQ